MSVEERKEKEVMASRPLSKALKDKFWLVVVALFIVAAGIITIGLVCAWGLRRSMT